MLFFNRWKAIVASDIVWLDVFYAALVKGWKLSAETRVGKNIKPGHNFLRFIVELMKFIFQLLICLEVLL